MKLFNKKETIKTFEEVKAFLNDIDSIGCGGCGISALVMYRWLKKHKQLPEGTKIFFLEHDEDNHNNNKRFISSGGNNDSALKAPCHVVMLYDGNYIDCTSVQFNITSRYDYILEIEEKYLVACLNNINSWNKMFERNKSLRKIEDNLNVNLSDIKRVFDLTDFM
jgi:hypothetical protein